MTAPSPCLLGFIFTLLLIVLSPTHVQCKRVHDGYVDSYVFLTVSNRRTSAERRICVNYLQYRVRQLPETAELAKGEGLGWWRGMRNQTKVCPLPDKDHHVDLSKKVVPLSYRIEDDGTMCTQQFNIGNSSFRNASQFEVNQIAKEGGQTALLLLDRGRPFVTKWRDFLFSDFYDPYINETTSIPTFFMYTDVFQSEVLSLVSSAEYDSDLEFRWHRPASQVFDLSMVFIWVLAMGCVAGGGTWAFFRHRAGKDKATLSATTSRATDTDAVESEAEPPATGGWCVRYANCFAIVLLMAFLVTILMLGFFFRPVLVMFFNALLVLFGSFSVYGCVHAFLSNFHCSSKTCCATQVCSLFPELGCISHRPTVLSTVLYGLSLGLCITWFCVRTTPYAFILLDFINITLCLHILKSLRLPSLKWISTLMMCMFVYDAIMVFATPLWTKNGCSVMLEVATGIDCSTSTNVGYPMPPIDAHLPEKFPMLMQVMHFDPMLECIDLEVERGFQMTILGLGDIIIPGYLVTHCFTMPGMSERSRLIYGIVCIIGYGVGLIATFVALTLMAMAQPALIYLVPFTLVPICLLALVRGEFGLVWNGLPEEDANKSQEEEESETGSLSVSIRGGNDPSSESRSELI